MSEPLAALLRPQTIEDCIGQQHLLGKDKPLAICYHQQTVFSMILWGPPGVGKTTVARLLAKHANRDWYELSAVSAGKKEIQAIVDTAAKPQLSLGTSQLAPVLFLDEIHRFNKAQQDFLLPHVEKGTLVLIGATTENPSFEVIPALLSRTRVFVLNSLTEGELELLLTRALKWFSQRANEKITLDKKTRAWLIGVANGDARQLLTILDHTWQTYHALTRDTLTNTLQSSHLRYDQSGEEHYNTISAFIKSMRASKVNAALYYLARMVSAGEDPKFIARRMIVFASEDIGLAQPTALVVANAVFEAVSKVGYPEAQINLAHGVAYLANCKKDRSAYDAYFAAKADAEKLGNLPIPLELRNAPTKLMKEQQYGQGYEMYPDDSTSYLPTKLKNKSYFVAKKSA
jgi:putative ATPase